MSTFLIHRLRYFLLRDILLLFRLFISIEMRALLVAGEPIKEPIVKYGPFVMNTEEEIRQVSCQLKMCSKFCSYPIKP